MCSKPVANTIARVTSGILTLGTSEIARNNLSDKNFLNQTLQTPGNIITGGQGGNGLITAGIDAITPKIPKPPEAPSPEDTTDSAPIPGAPAPGSTSVDSMSKRRKKMALNAGFMKTLATSGSGVSGAPILAAPTSSNLKLKLGQ